MKQPRKLKRSEKEALSAYRLNADEWMHLADVGETYIKVINKQTGKTKIIDKYARGRKDDTY